MVDLGQVVRNWEQSILRCFLTLRVLVSTIGDILMQSVAKRCAEFWMTYDSPMEEELLFGNQTGAALVKKGIDQRFEGC